MTKPKITWSKQSRKFQCKSVISSPGEICFVTGEGETPVNAFRQWLVVAISAETRIKKAIGGESIWQQIRNSYGSLRRR